MADRLCVTDCPINFWGDSSLKICVATCPNSNQFEDASDHRKCNTCDSTCTTCSATALTCTTCSGTRYLYSSACLTQCPVSFYAVTGAGNTNNLCLADCPDSQFKYDIDRTCQLSCPIPFYVNPQTKMCEDPCPSGMYKNAATQRCDLCDFNCQSCSELANSCDSCKYGWVKSGTSCTMPTNIYLFDSQLNSAFSSHSFTVINPGLATNHISDCGSYHILGGNSDFGQNTYVSKSYTNVVPHYRIRITFYFLKIDSWNSKTVSVFMNTNPEVLIDSKLFTINQDSSITQTCGTANIPEALRQFDIYKNHFTSDIDIKISTDLDVSSSVGSWGIYEFKLYVDRCHGTCLTCTGILSTQCVTCYSHATKNANNECLCDNNFYQVTIPAESCTTPPCTICTACNSECNNCDAGSNTDCLDCISPRFFYNKQCYLVCPEQFAGIIATRTCESQCVSSHEYMDASDRTCHPCHSECDSCSGPANTECLSCAAPYFLLFQNGLFKCVDQCGDDFTPDVALRVCKGCDPSCRTCDVSAYNDCLSCTPPKYLFNKKCLNICPDNYFGNNITITCEKSCPANTYGEKSSQTCWPCSTECRKCYGLSNNECLECEPKFYVQKTSCLKECLSGYFPIKETMKCDACLPKCIKCSNNSACEECDKDYFIQMPDQRNCVRCKEDGQILDLGNCYTCASDCKVCNDKEKCETCVDGFYLKSGDCYAQQSVIPTLIADEFSTTKFYLNFNKKWNDAFQIILFQPHITINGLNNNDFNYKIISNPLIANSFRIGLSFKSELPSGKILTINFNNLPNNQEFIISAKELTISLQEYKICPEGTKYDAGTKLCKNTTLVTASLDYTPTSNEIHLSFDKNFDSFWKILPNNTKISIDNMNFTSEFSIKDSDTYLIRFTFNKSFSNKPLCIVTFEVPDEISKNSSFTFKENPIFINLRDFYLLSTEMKSLIQITKETTSQMNTIASTTTMTNNFMSFGSSYAITAMMSMESIRFLRFLDIDYPPNVDNMFQSGSPIPGLVPNVNMEIDSEETLKLPFVLIKNDVSLFLFNNNGNLLIENFAYYLFAMFMIGLNNIANKTHFIYLKKIINFLTGIFVWNLVISYYLGVFMNYIFFDLLFMRYPATNSAMGKFNYGLAIFEVAFISCSLGFIALKIREMHIKTMNPVAFSPDLSNNKSQLPLDSPIFSDSDKDSLKKKKDHTEKPINSICFTPSRWSQIHTLMKPSISGPASLSKINPFEEGGNYNFQGIVGRMKRASLSWTDKKEDHFSEEVKRISRFSCLYDDMKHNNFGQSYYIMFDVIRQMCIAFMIVFFFNIPIVALGVINFINFEIFILLIFIRPLKEKINLIHTSINEFCVNVSCWSAFALSLMQTLEMGDAEMKMNIGWLMIGANGLLMFAVLVRFIIVLIEMVVYFLKLAVRYYKSLKNRKNNKVYIEQIEKKTEREWQNLKVTNY